MQMACNKSKFIPINHEMAGRGVNSATADGGGRRGGSRSIVCHIAEIVFCGTIIAGVVPQFARWKVNLYSVGQA